MHPVQPVLIDRCTCSILPDITHRSRFNRQWLPKWLPAAVSQADAASGSFFLNQEFLFDTERRFTFVKSREARPCVRRRRDQARWHRFHKQQQHCLLEKAINSSHTGYIAPVFHGNIFKCSRRTSLVRDRRSCLNPVLETAGAMVSLGCRHLRSIFFSWPEQSHIPRVVHQPTQTKACSSQTAPWTHTTFSSSRFARGHHNACVARLLIPCTAYLCILLLS